MIAAHPELLLKGSDNFPAGLPSPVVMAMLTCSIM
jgi:hypothetical protein